MSVFLRKNLHKKVGFLILSAFLLFSYQSKAQVFWNENFTTLGVWSLNNPTGINDPDANFFDQSDAEGGGITPNLGAPGSCGVAFNGNNSLFVTSSFASGAAYNSGGFCGIGICVTTNTRAESPVINCSGKVNISINFNYIENGDVTIDDAVMWYFDGVTWSILDNMPKTLTGCTGQGLWTSRTVNLPPSANNNPNVKIGFGWVNNDDGLGTDPSFAVDDITASTPVGGGLSTDPLAILNYCSCSSMNVSFTSAAVMNPGNIYTAQLSDAAGAFGTPVNIGTLPSVAATGTINCIIPCNTPNGTGYRVRVISSNPALTGADNGANITISNTPVVTITQTITNCMDTLTAVATGGINLPPANGTRYYIRDSDPWGTANNTQAMNAVFGVANYTTLNYAGAIPAVVFAPGTQFVFLEGADGNALALNTYITANITLIENWVSAGGRLFINSAPNQGGNMNWGFGGVVLNYNNPQGAVNVINPLHPIEVGPFLPTGLNFTGGSYSHAHITGGGTTAIIQGGGFNVLTEKSWGTGLVLFGGITSPNFHAPLPNAQNLWQNIINYCATSIIGPGYTFNWQPGGATTPVIVPVTPGTYTVTVTNNGCVGTATINAIVSPPPPTVTANANPGAVCPGGMTTLTGGGAATYAWTGGVIDNVPFAPPATATYTVTGTNANGCTGTSSVTVQVINNLPITVTANPSGICLGGSTALTANGATTYNWIPGNLNGTTVTVSPVVTTTYTVTGSNGAGCTGSTTITIYVNSITALTITLSGPPCNDTLTAAATAAGGGGGVTPGAKYYITDVVPWGQPNNVNEMNAVFGAGNWIQSNFSAPAATIFVPGTQFVFLEGGDGNGIALTNYMNANVTLIENWVSAGGRLFLNAAPNNGGIQNWGFGGTILNYINLLDSGKATIPAHPIFAGPYTPVQLNYDGNWFAHADVQNGGTMVMDYLGDAILTEKTWGTGLVMFGGMTTTNWHTPLVEAINLRQNILFYVAGSPLPAPVVTYNWQPGGATTAAIVPTVTGVYTVTATVNGCTSTATMFVQVNVPPVMTPTANPNTTCPGGNVTLQANGAATYVWQPGNLNGATQNVNPMATTTYTVTGTSAAGCVATATVTVTVTNNLAVTAAATPTIICVGGQATLDATGGTTYTWQPGGMTGPSVIVSPGATTTYTVTAGNGQGCTGQSVVTLTVSQPPALTVNVNPANDVCIGDPVTITAAGATNYAWTGGISNGVAFYPVANGIYIVTASNANGCTITSSVTITAVTPQAPNVNITSSPAPMLTGQFTSITALVPAYIPSYTLNWYRNNSYWTTTVGPANTVSYVPNGLSDSVYVWMTAVGCYDPDSVRSNGIAPRTPSGLDDVDAPNDFVMYPNPSNDLVNIKGAIAGDEMILTDVIGQTILRKKFVNGKIETIDITALANGIYYAKFMRGERSWVVKVKKQQ